MALFDEPMDSLAGRVFKSVFGREFETMREYDYWRNESIGRSVEELQRLMEAEKERTGFPGPGQFI